jgi:hypothetical protein
VFIHVPERRDLPDYGHAARYDGKYLYRLI